MKNRLTSKTDFSQLSQHEEGRMSAEESIRTFYRDHRNEFIHYGLKHNIDKENLIDIFQDIVIIYFEQKESGKINNLRCTEKTYLFSLGKYKIIDFLRRNSRTINVTHDQLPDESVDPKIINEVGLTDHQKLLAAGMEQLGKKCREIIFLFYYQQLSIVEIAATMGYKTENVVKANKSRCMKTLRQIVNKMENS